jgi:hypothetical protein
MQGQQCIGWRETDSSRCEGWEDYKVRRMSAGAGAAQVAHASKGGDISNSMVEKQPTAARTAATADLEYMGYWVDRLR